MRKIFWFALFLVMSQPATNACTTFFINKGGKMVFGRNYDWMTDAGMVCTNLKGIAKHSLLFTTETPVNWTSRYGSITFNQYGKEFPTGGMNEKGLVVELMWLDGTRYPSPDTRPAIGVLQWIQYQLDNAATVEEVIASDKKMRISAGATPLHYLVADASGNAATIEFLDGKMTVHQGSTLEQPVLTNSTYAQSLKTFKRMGMGGESTTIDNSLERFVKACNLISQYKSSQNNTADLVEYSFDILAEVAQGNSTKWSIVYDISNKKISFKTNRFKEIKLVDFAAFDFNCNATSKAWDMNQVSAGSVSKLFGNYTAALNKKIVDKSYDESKSAIKVDATVKDAVISFPASLKCQ